jgi:CheY-like chemotaxis protein
VNTLRACANVSVCDDLSGDEDRHLGKTQIVIAEDDPDLAQDLKDRLEGLSYEVSGVTQSGAEAITLTQTLRPDLVLMDIQLRGEMDGIQAAEQIRTFQVPVIYVSGYAEGPVIERAKLSEPYGYILKPYETSTLKISVEMGLHKHQAERERQRLLKRFQEVVASVKTLTGRLSICAYCKKIKDHVGDWVEIESYVMKHSDASFTHGMCPGCFEKVKKQIEALDEDGLVPGVMLLG